MNSEIKETNALNNKCPACNASIDFNPTIGKWKCQYCGSEYTLEEMQKYNNASNDKVNEGSNGDDTSYDLYRCKDCGAEIIADENTASTFCVYCGNSTILKSKLSGKFAPDFIIPFKTEKEKSITAFKNISKGRPLTPKGFNSEKNIEKIRGIYIPFWLYDINVDGSINANGEKVTSWTSGNTHYTKTDVYKLYRTASMNYEKIPVDGSTRFDDKIMNTIEPYDYKELKPYNHAYLSGFLSEKYDTSSDDLFKIAQDRAYKSTKNKMLDDMKGYTSKRIFEDTLKVVKNNTYYALLPVWMVNVKYNNKYYTFAMNGQTGEFIGNIPIDVKKTIIISISLFVGIFALLMLISFIAYLV